MRANDEERRSSQWGKERRADWQCSGDDLAPVAPRVFLFFNCEPAAAKEAPRRTWCETRSKDCPLAKNQCSREAATANDRANSTLHLLYDGLRSGASRGHVAPPWHPLIRLESSDTPLQRLSAGCSALLCTSAAAFHYCASCVHTRSHTTALRQSPPVDRQRVTSCISSPDAPAG